MSGVAGLSAAPPPTRWWWIRHAPVVVNNGCCYGQSDLPCRTDDAAAFKALAARLPAKVFVINENGDYFWLDRGQWRTILHFALFRAGLTGSGAVRTLARVVLFPFSLLYLILYAITVHFRRSLRT